MSGPVLDFDDTAQNPANKISAEPHVVSEINSQTERMIIPVYAPFYVQGFGLVHVDDVGERTPLNENVDFYFIMPYLGATYGTMKAVYGGIVLNNKFANGRIEVTYQSVGGPWVADPNLVRQALIEGSYNPRVVDWDVITNIQQTFPPADHSHSLEDMTRITDVIEVLQEIADSIAKGEPLSELTMRFLEYTSKKNPSGLTAADLGIPESILSGGATDQEVASMDPVNKFITVKQLMEFFTFPEADLTPLNNHVRQTGNVHGMTASDLGLGNIQNLEILDPDELEGPGLDKYVLHKHLVQMLSSYGKTQPHLTAAKLYFVQS